GNSLTWFPEGERSIDGELLRFLPGVGLLVQKTGVAAVPAHISGTFEAWPRRRKFPRVHPIRVRFGEPLRFEDDASVEAGHGADQIAEKLHGAVLALAAATKPNER
ncbi:MAG: lysophospholipid acyltransferase family protein, partial [Pseudomonadota bacterium]